MKKGRMTFGFGAITLLILLSMNSMCATATKQDQITIYVDSELVLTRKNLPLLEKYISKIKDNDVRIFVSEVIKLIEEKGIVNSEDAHRIITENTLSIRGIYFSKIISTDEDDAWCPGYMDGFPCLHMIRLFSFGGCLRWNADPGYWGYEVLPVDIGISGLLGYKEITYSHNGYSLGFFGIGHCVSDIDPFLRPPYIHHKFFMIGYSLLTMITV